MKEKTEREGKSRSFLSGGQKRAKKINERPGEIVCICEANGNVSVYDPNAYLRAVYRSIHGNDKGGKRNAG